MESVYGCRLLLCLFTKYTIPTVSKPHKMIMILLYQYLYKSNTFLGGRVIPVGLRNSKSLAVIGHIKGLWKTS